MIDRTTKLLLTTIALALWGFLLRPILAPLPSHASDAPVVPIQLEASRFSAPVVKIHPSNGQIYVVDNAGYMYMVEAGTLRIARSVALTPRPTRMTRGTRP